MPGLVIKPRARIFHGHDWVYSSEVKKTFGKPEPGAVISLKDFKDRPLGTAIYNPESQIVARRFSRRKQKLDQDFFERRINRALQHREAVGIDTSICRLIWSEADGLPGVVIDRYGDHLVLQTLTLAMDLAKEPLCDALEAVLSPLSITERNDSPIRAAEGLESVTGMLRGNSPEALELEINKIPLLADLREGQKTGLYLDQADNYSAVAELAKGKRVLDCFCNQGGFALAAAQAGATEVTGIDVSGPALEMAKANTERANLPAETKVEWIEANVFDFLRTASDEATAATHAASKAPQGTIAKPEPAYDLIVLDPPSFARSKKNVREAMRGYKEIHLRALKLLAPGGIIATFSCSHHVSRDELRDVAVDAAVDARRTLRELATYRQRNDHPVLPGIPETEYLQGFAFEIVPAW